MELAFPSYYARVIHDTLNIDGAKYEQGGQAVLEHVVRREGAMKKFDQIQDKTRAHKKLLHDTKNGPNLRVITV